MAWRPPGLVALLCAAALRAVEVGASLPELDALLAEEAPAPGHCISSLGDDTVAVLQVEQGLQKVAWVGTQRTLELASAGGEGQPRGGQPIREPSRLEKALKAITAPPEEIPVLPSYLAVFVGGLLLGIASTLVGVACFNRGQLFPEAETASASDATRVPEAEVPHPEAAGRKEEHTHSATESLESMHLFWPRLGVLVLLLLVQSLSSIIIDGFSVLFGLHPSLLFFLTMIVGTGGNVGGQSVVLAVRRLALGEEVLVEQEVWVGLKLSVFIAAIAFLRAWTQASVRVSLTIALATLVLVVLAAALGAATPKVLCMSKVDPAHATPMIQVMMDILGVFTVCVFAYAMLADSGST